MDDRNKDESDKKQSEWQSRNLSDILQNMIAPSDNWYWATIVNCSIIYT